MKKHSGFSAVELLVVVIIIFIIAVISLPNLSRMLSIYRVKGSAEGLAAQLNSARQQAIGQGRPIIIFVDPSNSRIFLDLNRNGIPEGFDSPSVVNRSAFNEEYRLAPSISLVFGGGSSCFSVPASFPNTTTSLPAVASAAPELGISNYTSAGWKAIVYDSRGELQLGFRQTNNTCINTNLSSSPAGAVVISCKQLVQNIKFTVSIALRGGVSVLTF
ncbi:MAG: prepilin-type N-terminal cleavage/methylation domain-containing protein [Blastocatellia bacterium]|nr:prepilin-type N-terminal cleavage/methylation domain-containing protein [Blastocatellia bacterium]